MIRVFHVEHGGVCARGVRAYNLSMSIFAKIISGQIPCHKVYEDAQVFSFLDINPLSRGHTLVVPKEAAVTLDQLSDEASAAIGRALPRICRAVMTATGATAFNILQNNGELAHQAVMHVHFHVIPRYERGKGDGVSFGPGTGLGLGIRWDAGSLDRSAGAELAGLIAAVVR